MISDNDSLTITYRTTGVWLLQETHAHVADDLGGIPTSGAGNPMPGRFQLSSQHGTGVSEFSYSIHWRRS